MSLRFSLTSWIILVAGLLPAAERNALAQGAPSGVHADPHSLLPWPPLVGGPRVSGVDIALGGTNEPCVTVNPLNRQNVAMASLFQSRVSTNAGGSWSAALTAQVTAGYGLDGDSTMAFDSQGRLFWEYLGFNNATSRGEVFISQLNPTTGAFVAGPFRITTSGAAGTGDNDKGWLAADHFPSSPFRDRLYVAWSDFGSSPVRVLFSFSLNQGSTWSAPQQLSTSADGGFPWPTHVAVGPEGNVYVSYHDGSAGGTTGRVWLLRSTNGGASFDQKNMAYNAGFADTTYNVQTSPGIIPGTQFWLQGSGQAWVLPDPKIPGNVYVVASDDPDNVHGSGDDSNIYIVRSTNAGATWSAPAQVDHGTGTSFQVMPTAAMDDQSGCIVVMWYDNRLGFLNGNGHYMLDVFYSISRDHGVTFLPDVQINDAHFDPDLGAPQRFPGPPPTLRIGEYIGVAMGGGNVYGVWCGNTVSGQQTMFDSALLLCGDCNNNGINDADDIANHTSLDCNSDGIPDECQVPPLCPTCADCNHDGIPDNCQVPPRCPACPDCNSDGVPDSCQLDCNSNGRPDNCDIALGFSQDCQPDSVPDECQIPPLCPLCPDCNHNNIPDFCDLALGDCNNDGVPDRCQTDPLLCGPGPGGPACLPDCDHNFVPDSCQLVGSYSQQSPNLSPLYNPIVQTYTLTAPPAASGTVSLTFMAVGDIDASFEFVAIDVNGTAVGNAFAFDAQPCPLVNQNVLTVSAATWNAAVAGGNAAIHMVPNNQVNNTCEPDSYISVKVEYPITTGDCNQNSILDVCEIAAGTVYDCNRNSIPDSCEIAAGQLTDSDFNGRADECECIFTCHGDFNFDSIVNGDDTQLFVNCILSNNLLDCGCADMNSDFKFTAADVSLYISRLLNDPNLNCH